MSLWLLLLGAVLLVDQCHCMFLANDTFLENFLGKYTASAGHSRSRRAIARSDREEIVHLHNKLRGQVHPSSSNMEYMTWDDELERSAEAWAQQCLWEHGPPGLLMAIGQNLAVHWGRYRSPAFHVQSWYDEVKDYTYPYPHECNPFCPDRCSGPMCTHYTQIVWATTTKVGCAVNVCKRMNVWGEIWENAVYLVCNYSPKGNWIGEAPYKNGRPCSECPPSYGGNCKNNLCYKGDKHAGTVETDETNEVESPRVPEETLIWVHEKINKPKVVPKTPQPKTPQPKTPQHTENLMTQVIKCETRMRDKCKGSTCNRYFCPAGCASKKVKIFGTLFYESMSSLCRAAIHYGVIDNNGGLVDITRKGRLQFFVKSTRNGVESLSKFKPGNSFMVSKVTVQTIDCYSSVAEICPYEKPGKHCPRFSCPGRCKDEPSHWAPVIGSSIYADTSSICRTAVHAGVIKDESGGYVDVMPVDRKNHYIGSKKNGIHSESIRNRKEGKAFRVFAVKQ
ncbi:cysteine-rich secretory protein LCCL domain-containing 2 isoform X2 [Phyllobates terribilis]